MILPNTDEQSVRFFVSPVTDIEPGKGEKRARISTMTMSASFFMPWIQLTSARLNSNLPRGRKCRLLVNWPVGVAHDFNNVLTAIIGFFRFAAGKSPALGPGISGYYEYQAKRQSRSQSCSPIAGVFQTANFAAPGFTVARCAVGLAYAA